MRVVLMIALNIGYFEPRPTMLVRAMAQDRGAGVLHESLTAADSFGIHRMLCFHGFVR